MRYLRKHGVSLPLKRRIQRWTCISKTESFDHLTTFAQTLVHERNSRNIGNRLFGTLRTSQRNYFVKTTEITQLKAQLKATFGVQRRTGGYGWPIAEIINTTQAIQRGLSTPELCGFGYKRSKLGLVNEIFIVTDWLDEHINGLEWLQSRNAHPKEFVKSCFQKMKEMHQKRIWHLDFWVENVVLSSLSPNKLTVIDLENCYIGETDHISETLGFQFGFFYYREIGKYLSEKDYDRMVAEALEGYVGIDKECFYLFYNHSKNNHVGRKDRRKIPLKGFFPQD